MAEVHVIGTILGASGFPSPNLCCRWSVVAGEEWQLLEGLESGQTQVDLPQDHRFTAWSHPLDVHYTTKTVQGWPKLHFTVFHQDAFGRNELYGYGFVHVPTSSGTHDLDVVTWRPTGTFKEQIASYFLGVNPQLKSMSVVHTGADRFRLTTTPMGRIHLQVGLIVRKFAKYGVIT